MVVASAPAGGGRQRGKKRLKIKERKKKTNKKSTGGRETTHSPAAAAAFRLAAARLNEVSGYGPQGRGQPLTDPPVGKRPLGYHARRQPLPIVATQPPDGDRGCTTAPTGGHSPVRPRKHAAPPERRSETRHRATRMPGNLIRNDGRKSFTIARLLPAQPAALSAAISFPLARGILPEPARRPFRRPGPWKPASLPTNDAFWVVKDFWAQAIFFFLF